MDFKNSSKKSLKLNTAASWFKKSVPFVRRWRIRGLVQTRMFYKNVDDPKKTKIV